MPKVGEKEFPYTPEGVQAAAEESSESGMPVQDAGSRNESYQLGGLIPGQEGFGQNPMMKQPAVTIPQVPQRGQSTDNRWHDIAKKLTGYFGYEKGGKVGRKRKSSKFTPEQEKVADEALKQDAKNVKDWKQGKVSREEYKSRQKLILRRMDSYGIK